MNNKPASALIKKLAIGAGFFLLLATIIVWYLFSLTFQDTKKIAPDATISAKKLLQAYHQNFDSANLQYTEKIITINGRITNIEQADSTFNITMADSSGAYLIFTLQSNEAMQAKQLSKNDSIAIKGSCSGAIYSTILTTFYVPFKRCIIEKK